MKKIFKFSAKVHVYPVPAGWHFVSLPKKTTDEINFFFSHVKRGWGSLPVLVTLGKTSWKTSIFADTKMETFLLPLKVEIRKKEILKEGDKVKLSLEIRDNL